MADLKTAEQQIEGWFEHPLGFKFKIKTASNRAYRMAAAEICSKHRGVPAGELLISERPAFQEALIRHLLSDWSDIEVDGHPMPFSVEKAIEILLDPHYEALFDFIDSKAVSMAQASADFDEESEKN